jgi:phage gp46-like protein
LTDAPRSNVLWDTIWSTDPALGTTGDWRIQPTVEDTLEATLLDGEVTIREAFNSGGLQNVDPIGTAVLLCLASDARLPDYMIGRFGFTVDDQREWHGNTTAMASGEEPLGSLLWILRRAPLSDYTAKMAEHFAASALQVLVRQNVVAQFDIHAEVNKVLGRLSIYIRAYTPDQSEREWRHDLYPIQ